VKNNKGGIKGGHHSCLIGNEFSEDEEDECVVGSLGDDGGSC